MKSSVAHSAAAAVALLSGVSLWLLAAQVDTVGALTTVGWWALGVGFLLTGLAAPGLKTFRDALLPTIALVVFLAALGYSLPQGLAVAGIMIGLALGAAPAISGFIRLTMPDVRHLGAVALAGLAVVAMASIEIERSALFLAGIGGLALVGYTLLTQRVLHEHPVIRFHAAGMLISGAILTGAGIVNGESSVPTWTDTPLLVAGIVVLGALGLGRIRLTQRLGALGARRHLPWVVVATLLFDHLAGDGLELGWWLVGGLVAVGGFLAAAVPSDLTEAESFRIGP